ncbi:MAG: hypothetical protein HY904_08045 [Deltaproteobacteria bacterium]|nr:hypothetical protein [Deltaproteobacteria bacterium]
MKGWMLLLGGLWLGGCRQFTDASAEKTVRAYNARVIEAYRSADPALVEPVAGPDEAKKLTGSIGVKVDQGITLDSELLELSVDSVRRTDERVTVVTRESWRYRDRRIGTGEQVGQSSQDRYHMEYDLQRVDGTWKVVETRFASPPQVGRTEVPNQAPADVLHGVIKPPLAPAPEPK